MCPSELPEQDAAAEKRLQSGFAQSTIERLFEFTPNAIVIVDSQGVIRRANPRVEELFGYTSNELIGQPGDMLVPERFRAGHPERRETDRATLLARHVGKMIDLFGLHKDGTEFPVDILLKPMETESGPVTVSFIRDATEKRAALEALRLNDLRLRLIVENISEYAIYLLDLEGNILTWNPGAEHIKGYKANEVLGSHFSRFFLEEDLKRGGRRRLAGAQRWFALLGQHRAHCDSRFDRHGDRVCQDYARRDRP
jgi:formate hydrogenlyase transcriptional activator